MTKALVTGASGFVGHHLVAHLVEDGTHVRCLVRPTSGTDRLRKMGVELVEGNVTDAESLRRAVRGVDVVYHLAGVTKSLRKETMCEVNEVGSRLVAEACAAGESPPVLVAVSSLAAAGPSSATRLRTEADPERPVSVYGKSKRAGELAVAALAGDVPATIVRPPIVFGEGDTDMLDMIRPVVRFRLHAAPGLLTKRFSLIHADDLSAGIRLAAEKGERLPADRGRAGQGIYFLAHDEHPTYIQLGHHIAHADGKRFFIPLRLPILFTWIAAGGAELLARYRRQPLILNFDKAREASAGSWSCSPQQAKTQLGFQAASLDERLKQTIAWYRREGWL